MALYTKADLEKKTPGELKKLANNHGVDTDGLNKKGLIDELLALEEEEVNDEELDDDEVEIDDEELDDEELEADEVDDIEEAPAPKKAAAKKSSTPAKKAKAEGDGNTLAAKQVATILKTEAKTLRQFFRSSASTIEPVGSGGRYEFAEEDVPKIQAEFDKWRSEHAGRGKAKGSGKKSNAKPAEELEEVEEIEELEDEELDDEIDDEDLELDDEEE